MPTYKYPRPSVTVDAVVFGVQSDSGLEILLIRRKGSPFKDFWALPGGFVNMNESLDDAAKRELEEETGIVVSHLEQLYTYGAPKRDPRGRVISIAYFALTPTLDHSPKASSDAAEARWFPVSDLPDLAFDHASIVATAVSRLKAKVRYSPVGFGLLPGEFTLTQLQGLYECLIDSPLDKRNFQRRMLGLGFLKKTGREALTTPRSALYRFDRSSYRELEKSGIVLDLKFGLKEGA
jgi:8-oxo-dGTP diphosphatase